MLPLTLIVARARGGAIGLRGGLPWGRIPEDMRRFRAATMDHTCIVGRATAEGLPRLQGRKLVLVSRAGVVPPRVVAADNRALHVRVDVAAALDAARETDPEPVVIGGAQVYAAALPYVTRVLVTEIDRDVEADTFFAVDFAAEGFRDVSQEIAMDVAFVEWRRG